MARKQKRSGRKSGSIRVRQAAAGYVARASTRDNEVAARIEAMVEEGAEIRREIEERIEARFRARR